MRKAFTLLELVFVLVVIGILAAVIIPKTRTNPVREAAIQLVSHIRYAQHLAMVDDKFDSNATDWYKNRWQMSFNDDKYSIVSEDNTTFATDPMNPNVDLSHIDLDADYSTTIALGGGCAGRNVISFDHLGRPMIGSLDATTAAYTLAAAEGQLLITECDVNLTNSGETVTISIEPETGYARIIN